MRDEVIARVRAFFADAKYEGRPVALVMWTNDSGDCFEVEDTNGHYWKEKYLEAHPEDAEWISSGVVALVVLHKPQKVYPKQTREEARRELDETIAALHKLLEGL